MQNGDRMKHCYRCGERKEGDRFRPGQPYWNRWCLRCERTPTGWLPLPQEKEDVWRDSDEVSPT
ncbi:protein NinD [Escherichia coli]|uniref:protein NinD n=2 Tax=Escherichia coli TaxID=562 RepID=UPI002948BAD4|nr:protein NinD [Escherichia coli]